METFPHLLTLTREELIIRFSNLWSLVKRLGAYDLSASSEVKQEILQVGKLLGMTPTEILKESFDQVFGSTTAEHIGAL